MANRFNKPSQISPATISSGFVGAGEFNVNTGGQVVYTSFSGIGVDTLITQGAGRLKSIEVLNNTQSGQPVVFYDSAVATSGGPFSTSGHKILGIIPAVWALGASGVINQNSMAGARVLKDRPFFSGLCAAVAASGSSSWTCDYVLEVSGYCAPSVQ